ncbi:CoA transferase [Natronosporangium hydrolyticum]|uniref:CoA transferase n=1 Tax=Natronosporangium hydrolyticum TaxID=2811111 RepID=A0A895YEA5_9ACTN|nr:CaiB/BaiF CoA-transferase family protein [Natronosporangium hydrolyticum]QSB14495.1 CoA transferase [Natronosporangium hydrolyticum]
MTSGGPLAGLRVVELAGVGPAPFAGMVLADHGAEVLRVDRPGGAGYPIPPRLDLLNRGKRSVALDLKQPAGAAAVRALARRADLLLEGFRPGVAERLGVGPEQCRAEQPRLVYARMTGWGQHGPLAHTAGHDLTYLALSGVLHAVGPPGGPPTPPANLLGDYGGGGMLLVAGALAALWRAERTGVGEVIDAAIVDGSALLATQLLGLRHSGQWRESPGGNLLDGGAPFYAVYPTADHRYVAVAALEPPFFAQLLAGLGLDPATTPGQAAVADWPRLRALLEQRFATRTRDEWAAVFAGTDACVAPVLDWTEAAAHPQLADRGVYRTAYGVSQPAPAPRFAESGTAFPAAPPPVPGEHTRQALAEWGVEGVTELLATGVAVQADPLPAQ